MEFEKYKLQEVGKTILPVFRYRKQVRRLKSPFLRGPIPLDWLQRAMKLGGTAISVGIVLWYFNGLKRLAIFKVGIQDIARLIGRSWLTAKRGLITLEREGLIRITRHKGRKHLIEIREIDSGPLKPSSEISESKNDARESK